MLGKIRFLAKYGIILFASILLFNFPLRANDDALTPDLYIKSTTTVNSAHCIITGTDQEEDKKRTEIGVGETVYLELMGKRLNEVTSVSWKILPNENWASATPQKDDNKKAVLEAKKNPTANGVATVSVTTNIDSVLSPPGPRQKTFQVLVPTDIKGNILD